METLLKHLIDEYKLSIIGRNISEYEIEYVADNENDEPKITEIIGKNSFPRIVKSVNDLFQSFKNNVPEHRVTIFCEEVGTIPF